MDKIPVKAATWQSGTCIIMIITFTKISIINASVKNSFLIFESHYAKATNYISVLPSDV